MLPHRNRRRVRRHITHPAPRLVSCKCERRFHFRVQRKILGVRQINRAARSIQFVCALLRAPQSTRHPMRIAQIKIRRIHQHVPILFRRRRESPYHRLRKRIMHRALFIRIIAHRAKIQILFNQQNLRPTPFEPHNPRRAQLPAIQSNVVRTNSRRQSALVQKLRVPLINLQPQLPGLRIPIQIEIARQLLRVLGLLRNAAALRTRSRHASNPSAIAIIAIKITAQRIRFNIFKPSIANKPFTP